MIYAEEAFPVAELAWALEQWSVTDEEPRDDFEFDSMSFDVPGAVRLTRTNDGWIAHSCFEDVVTAPRPWTEVHDELNAFVEAVKIDTAVTVRDATGSMAAAILAMVRAFDMSLVEAKESVIDAVGGLNPVDQRLHEALHRYLSGDAGMRATVLAVADDTSSAVEIEGPAGRLRGTWVGPLPGPGDVVDVEVDVEPCSWTDVLIAAESTDVPEPTVGAWLHGVVERIDPDGVLVLRSGRAITLVEMTGPQRVDALGATVALPAIGTRLFPVQF
ncbi:hypothetical protein [Antribacter gilvus]|uniref:DUF7878 domain-containing protein n=1 Tax=Antribacter gilvus TaxID=2304675 RepID=UPI0013DFE366|nr:hypothetical protein [Antribacter gilvus]